MVEVIDLTKWDGVVGLYIMVLDEYRQAYVGATDASVGILKRIKQHWTGDEAARPAHLGRPADLDPLD